MTGRQKSLATAKNQASIPQPPNLQPSHLQGGSNMTETDLCVNKPHCTAAVQCGLFTHKSVPVIFERPSTTRFLSQRWHPLVLQLTEFVIYHFRNKQQQGTSIIKCKCWKKNHHNACHWHYVKCGCHCGISQCPEDQYLSYRVYV